MRYGFPLRIAKIAPFFRDAGVGKKAERFPRSRRSPYEIRLPLENRENRTILPYRRRWGRRRNAFRAVGGGGSNMNPLYRNDRNSITTREPRRNGAAPFAVGEAGASVGGRSWQVVGGRGWRNTKARIFGRERKTMWFYARKKQCGFGRGKKKGRCLDKVAGNGAMRLGRLKEKISFFRAVRW